MQSGVFTPLGGPRSSDPWLDEPRPAQDQMRRTRGTVARQL